MVAAAIAVAVLSVGVRHQSLKIYPCAMACFALTGWLIHTGISVVVNPGQGPHSGQHRVLLDSMVVFTSFTGKRAPAHTAVLSCCV
jgi:hypothetical protein